MIKKTSNKNEIKDVTNSTIEVNQVVIDTVNLHLHPSGKNEPDKLLTSSDVLQTGLGEFKGLLSNSSSNSVSSELNSEYHEQLNYARDLIDNFKPQTALDFLIDLKKRIWHKALEKTKFRILTNIGASYLALGDSIKGAKFLIEAHQYEESEKSWGNLATGQLIFGNVTEAEQAAKEVLIINPSNEGAYSILIQVMGDRLPIADIIKEIPPAYLSLPIVQATISQVACKQKDYPKALRWTNLVLNDKENLGLRIEVKLLLASILLEAIFQGKSLAESELINKEKKKIIVEAGDILNNVWNELEKTQLKPLKIQCLANRSFVYRILGDKDNSLSTLESALELEPGNTHFLAQKAALYFEKGKLDPAKKILIELIDIEESAPLLYAEILRREGKINGAQDVINSALTKIKTIAIEIELKRYLIDLYLESNRIDDAEGIANLLDESILVNLVSQSSVLRAKKEFDRAKQKLEIARNLIQKSNSPIELVSLAGEYYHLGLYSEAAEYYELLADPLGDTSLTRRLLDCYIGLGNDNKILEITRGLRKKNGINKDFTELESSIYEKIGDLPSAQQLCKDHLNVFVDDGNIKVRLAMILFRQQNIDEIHMLLESGIDDSKLSLFKRIQLAQVYSLVGNPLKAIYVAYEARRMFFSESDAHAKYIGIFFNFGKTIDLSAPIVILDTAVCIEEFGKERWLIIEDRSKSDLRSGELNSDHPLAKKLLGRSKGDLIILLSNEIQTQSAKIIEVKSKFIYALQESCNIFNEMFPDDKSFMALSLNFSGKMELPSEFKLILDNHSDYTNKVTEFFKNNNVTLAMLSYMLGKNVIDTWGYSVTNPEIGIRCAIGSIEERKSAQVLLNTGFHVGAIDISAILTLHGLGLANIVSENFSKLIIPQSTKDLLLEVISLRKGIESDGFHSIGRDESGKYVKSEVSEELIRKNTKYLESILEWINNKCEVVPCQEALKLSQPNKELYLMNFEPSFIETALLAKQEGVPFFSDDLWLRVIMKNEFNVDGYWSQIFLQRLVFEGKLLKTDYDKALIKLILSRYNFISIDSDVLIESASQAGWHNLTPFIEVSKVMGGGLTDWHTSVKVIEDFSEKLYSRQIFLPSFSELFFNLLDSVIPPLSEAVYTTELISRIKNRLGNSSSIYKTIENEIRKWLNWREINIK